MSKINFGTKEKPAWKNYKENNKDWRERFDERFKRALYASCQCWVDADKEIKDFIEETIKKERLKWEEEEQEILNKYCNENLDLKKQLATGDIKEEKKK